MGSFSDYWENEVLDHLFGKGNYSPPTIYVGLSSTDPTDSGAGLSEPSGGSYARVATAAGDWTAAADGALENANAITFDTPTGDWGLIAYFALFDALSGGNMLAQSALTDSYEIMADVPVYFQAGELVVTLD